MTDRWVDGFHGNNANPGTRSFPWETIQFGVDWLASHKQQTDEATLHILPYQCDENVRMSGPSYSWIRVVGDSAAVPNPAIIAQFCEARPPVVAANSNRPVFSIREAEYVRIRNLNISGGSCGVKVIESPGFKLQECCIHDNKGKGPGGGLLIGKGCDHARVEGCRVWANKARGKAGGGGSCVSDTSDVRIEGSVFVHNEAVNGDGGALLIEKCEQVKVLSCTIGAASKPPMVGNKAQNGGGVFVRKSKQISLGNPGAGNSITRNQAAKNGGGVVLWDSSDIRLYNNRVTGNTAALNGGGLAALNGSSLTSTRDEFFANRSDVNGGGMFADSSSLTLTEIEVNKNRARLNGGGICATGANVYLEIKGDSKIHHNKGSLGGGVCAHQGTIGLRHATFDSNSATTSGGGFYLSGDVNVESCMVTNNTANLDGGGGAAPVCDKLRISLVTFEKNQSNSGGGLYVSFKFDGIVTDNKFESNQATTGGGIYAFMSDSGSITRNQLFYNVAGEGAGLTCAICKLPSLRVTRNEFRSNRVKPTKTAKGGGDIYLSYCNLATTPAQISTDNTVNQQVPDVEHS